MKTRLVASLSGFKFFVPPIRSILSIVGLIITFTLTNFLIANNWLLSLEKITWLTPELTKNTEIHIDHVSLIIELITSYVLASIIILLTTNIFRTLNSSHDAGLKNGLLWGFNAGLIIAFIAGFIANLTWGFTVGFLYFVMVLSWGLIAGFFISLIAGLYKEFR